MTFFRFGDAWPVWRKKDPVMALTRVRLVLRDAVVVRNDPFIFFDRSFGCYRTYPYHIFLDLVRRARGWGGGGRGWQIDEFACNMFC